MSRKSRNPAQARFVENFGTFEPYMLVKVIAMMGNDTTNAFRVRAG